MRHLLVIESWIGASAILLPKAFKELGYRFTFVTRDLNHYLKSALPGEPHPLLLADQILNTETNDAAALYDYLEREHQRLGFDGVLTTCDYYLETVARVAERLGLPGTSPAAVQQSRLKHQMRDALDRAGLPNPTYRLTSTWEEVRSGAAELGYPVVLKPVDLCASMYVRLVQDESELREAFDALEAFPVNARKQARSRQVLLEAYLDGEEVSVETCTYRGETTVIGITDKSVTGFPAFIESGHMFPAQLDPEVAGATRELVRNALAAVGFDHGIAHTEVKLTSDGPRIVEINVRTPGNYITELIRHVTGIDLLGAMVQLSLGEQPSLTPIETGVKSAAIQFILPPSAGLVCSIAGVESVADDPDVVDFQLKPIVGCRVSEPASNNDYLGRVMVVDRSGSAARARAEAVARQVQFGFAEAVTV